MHPIEKYEAKCLKNRNKLKHFKNLNEIGINAEQQLFGAECQSKNIV